MSVAQISASWGFSFVTANLCSGHVSLAVLFGFYPSYMWHMSPAPRVSMAMVSLPSPSFCSSLGKGVVSHVAPTGLKLTSMCHHAWFVVLRIKLSDLCVPGSCQLS